MTEHARAAVAAAFPSSDGGTIVVSVGPNGCLVSKNQRHIRCVVDGVFVLDVPEPLPQVDVDAVRYVESGVDMLLMAMGHRGLGGAR